MKSTRLEGVHLWSVHQPERRIDFNGFLWCRDEGNVLVDPMPLSNADRDELERHGGARWIVLTNFDHLRATEELRERLGAEVWAPEGERERFGDAASLVGGWFERASDLPGGLADEVGVHLLRGGKSPVEAALWLAPVRALLFGDLVRSHASGTLRLLPPEKLADESAARASLAPLAELPVEAILLGDGDSLFRGARAALDELLAPVEAEAR